MSGEQKIRAALFYLGLLIFLIGLPIILSFALGYKFNPASLKFTKTGLIALKTQPSGASIYLDSKLLTDKTPASLNEIIPGRHNIRLELEDYYPWQNDVSVFAGRVTRLEKIILFPLRSVVRQLNQDRVSTFYVDKDNGKIYYINQEENVVYQSDFEGNHFEEIGKLPQMLPYPKKYKVSPDNQKLLCFNLRQIAVIRLQSNLEHHKIQAEPPVLIDYPNERLVEVFWHSDSYHLILVANKSIEVLEADSESSPVSLVSLNKKNTLSFYDQDSDMLYFLDSQRSSDEKFYDNVYKLDLSGRSYPFHDLLMPKQKSNE